MRISKLATRLRNHSVVSATILALVGAQTGFAQAATAAPSAPSFGPNSHDLATHTPISTSSSSSAKIGALTASSRRTSLSPAKQFGIFFRKGS